MTTERARGQRALAQGLGVSKGTISDLLRRGVLVAIDGQDGLYDLDLNRRRLAAHRKGDTLPAVQARVAAAIEANETWPLGVLATSDESGDRETAALALLVLREVNSAEGAEELRRGLSAEDLPLFSREIAAQLGDERFARLPRPERIRSLHAWSQGVTADGERERVPQDAFPPRSRRVLDLGEVPETRHGG